MSCGKFLASLGTIFVLMAASPAGAADASDIYLEVSGGSNLKTTTQLIGCFNAGYVVVDTVGIGVSFNQVIAATAGAESATGSSIGLEGRWFLEPFEVAGVAGTFIGAGSQKDFFLEGIAQYLLAITPSIAAKGEVRARYVFGQTTAFYVAVGARILF